MRTILAAIGFVRVGFVILFGTIGVVITSFLPFKHKGIPISGWVATWMARRFVKIFRIDFECRERDKFLKHDGFIFPNHDSYLDIILPMSVMPMRFLAMAEVADYPLIGRVAKTLGTVFVDRSSKESRQQARESLKGIKTFPPIILYPEGGIDQNEGLSPFRYGAFELAVENNVSFLPAAIIYTPFEVAVWDDVPLLKAVWRVATAEPPLQARLVALRTIHPTPDDNPKELAMETHGAIAAALKAYGGKAYDVIEEGL